MSETSQRRGQKAEDNPARRARRVSPVCGGGAPVPVLPAAASRAHILLDGLSIELTAAPHARSAFAAALAGIGRALEEDTAMQARRNS